MRCPALWLAVCCALAACSHPPQPAPAQPVAPAPLSAAAAAVPPAGTASTPAPPRPAASAAARPGEPAPPRPFAEVTREASVSDGLFPLWRKDDRVWIEIPEARLNQPLLLTVNIAESLGESGLYAGQMGPSWMVELRRVGNTVQVLARNTAYRAEADPAMQRAVAQGFSPSLLAAMPLASAPHPERKSLLVDAAFLLADIPNYAYRIESALRLAYNLDRANSHILASSTDVRQTSVSTRMHFSTARIPVPGAGASSGRPPATAPDARSFFATYVYSFSPLPEPPMAPRRADPRLGHFTTAYTDMSSDLRYNQRVHLVHRWRLEKKEPAAAVSEPVRPITYWLDRNIPQRYRKAVEAGVLEWNKAFEAIGFRNAIEVRQQPDDASWDTMDAVHASIRWYVGAEAGSAIGPVRTDPRTGEIIDADIAMSELFARGARRFITELAPRNASAHAGHDDACHYAEEAGSQAAFAMDLLEARGELEPDSPEAEAFVQLLVKNTIMHEVGHTLGLKHNFKASTVQSEAQLAHSPLIAGSVMDYLPYNLALKGEPRRTLVQDTIGPYDYWAIAYAYTPLAPAAEAAGLAAIAARSTEPALAYGDDSDAGSGPEGLDPTVNRFDLGSDPLAYYKRRIRLAQELWQSVQERTPRPGDDPLRTRRALASGFAQVDTAADLMGKYVGGMVVTRTVPGGTAQRTFTPVEPARQREALAFLTDTLLRSDSFRFRPEFLTSLGVDFNEWGRDGPPTIGARVLQVQRRSLDKLLGASTAHRLLEMPALLPQAERRSALSLQEVYATLQSAIWEELRTGREPDPQRRALQREHLQRVTALLTRPSGLPPEALALLRLQARQLLADLRKAAGRPATLPVRAHLQDSSALLDQALKASITRS